MPGAAPTTFNLSQLYRALGVRDPRVIPNMEGGTLIPTVSLGEFRSFAPEVIEARGFFNSSALNILGGQWVGIEHQSTAPGGTVIEAMGSADNVTWNLAPIKPFAGAPIQPFSIGGQVIQSLFEGTGINVGPFPTGISLGGTNTNAPTLGAQTAIVADLWIPPSWWFWAIMGPNPTAFVSWRFREVPESQGPV